MGRSFFVNGFNPNKISAAAERSDQAREALINGIIASAAGKRVGIDREGIANAARFVKAQGHDAAPTLKRGVAGPAMVKGEVFSLTDEHTNAAGERVLEGYRRNGPHMEKVRIVEAQFSEHTRVVSRILGGR